MLDSTPALPTNQIFPNRRPSFRTKLELGQAVVRFERLPDAVQKGHVDWGFRLTPMYGIDYRWTTAQGWFSGQLLNHKRLYGFDPVEAYGLILHSTRSARNGHQIWALYFAPDIEAQLAPDNYLYTHSLMFTFDCYTQTGINAAIKIRSHLFIEFENTYAKATAVK